MTTAIEAQLRGFLAENILFLEDADAVADDASFIAEGLIDSIGITELVEFIRRQFGIEVPLADIVPANFDSISRLAGYVRRRLAEGASGSPENPGAKEPTGAELKREPNGEAETKASAGSRAPLVL